MIAPLLFYLSGEAIPDDLEGRLPEELIAPDYLARHPVTRIPADQMPSVARDFGTPRRAEGITKGGPDGAASDELVEKLRALGYID